MKYEIRQIDAWADENGWNWNSSIRIGEFTTNASNHKQAFSRALRKMGIVCKRGMCRIDYDGDIYELQSRKDLEPLFAAIPIY